MMQSIAELRQGQHACLVYDDPVVALAQAALFAARGLREGERTLWILGGHEQAAVLDALTTAGVDPEQELARSALVLVSEWDVSFPEGAFDPRAMVAYVRRAIEDSLATGFRGLRVVAEMTWTFELGVAHNKLIHYEALGNGLYTNEPLVALCMYDRRRHAPEVCHDALRVHPVVATTEGVVDNVFCELPPALAGETDAAELLDQMLGQLATLRDIERHRTEQQQKTANELAARREQERKQSEVLRLEQNRLLELIARGTPAEACMTALTETVSRIHPMARAAVLTTNAQRTEIQRVYAARFDPSFGAPIAGLRANTQPVGVLEATSLSSDDLAADERFSRRWRDHCRAHGVRACRATPVFGEGNKTVGAFALLFGEPHELDDWEIQVAEFGAFVASIILERERAEEALRRAGELDAFRVRLSDALRTAGDPLEIQVEACRLLGECLDVDRAFYVEFDHAAGESRILGNYLRSDSPSLAGTFRLADYGWVLPFLQRGDTLVVDDTETSDFISTVERAAMRGVRVGSHISVPLNKSGVLVGALCVTEPGPRQWTQTEIDLVRETGERIWAAIERASAERALRESEERLRDADRHKDEFLALLAHELRNPLASISNGVHVMQHGGTSAAGVTATAATLQRQVVHMTRLVDDLLDVSRITRGKIELRPQRVALSSIIDQAVTAANPLITCMNHTLTVTMPSQELWLQADPVRLAQVVGNLLNNACKYMNPGGHIALVVERADDEAVIRVRDRGIGMAPEQLPRIFDMFTQLDTSLERSVGGLGIGLTLVRSLVEMHGGTVEARSEGLGTGSELIVRLPLAAMVAASASATVAAPATAARHRILVVDDNLDGAELLAMMLESDGHETYQAHDGLEALQAAERLRPELVLLDIGLPTMNGYDVCRQIRQQPWGKDLVVVAVTGWGQDGDREKSTEAGFDMHIVKPIPRDTLTKVIAGLPSG